MTSSNGNICRVAGLLCGEFTGNSPYKGQWRTALIFSLICAWINGWVNDREAGESRRHRDRYDVIVMHRCTHRCTDESWHPVVLFEWRNLVQYKISGSLKTGVTLQWTYPTCGQHCICWWHGTVRYQASSCTAMIPYRRDRYLLKVCDTGMIGFMFYIYIKLNVAKQKDIAE